jgi:hypothetical protein
MRLPLPLMHPLDRSTMYCLCRRVLHGDVWAGVMAGVA